MIKLIQKLFFLFFVFFTLSNSYGEEYVEYEANPPIKNPPALEKRFPKIKAEDYKVEVYKGKFAKTVSSAGYEGDKEFFEWRVKENAQEALDKKEVNFAGEYVVFTAGCGSGCWTEEIINVKTGEVTHGITFQLPAESGFEAGSSYTKDSRLFYVEGMIYADATNNEGKKMGGGDSGSFVFEFKDGKFKLLDYKPILKIYEYEETENEDTP